MPDALATLRDELAADLDVARSYGATDWLREAVDTVLAPGLVARSTVHACVYAITHAERGAETTFSVVRRPIVADAWRDRDDVQAAALGVVALGFFATDLASLPAEPALAALVALQCVPLALDPALTLAEVAR
jgi:hypothetical protein